jgi:hypothetical protein
MDTWRLKQDLMLWIPMACKFLALKCVHVSGAIETLSDFLIAHVFLIAQMSPSSMSRVLVCVCAHFWGRRKLLFFPDRPTVSFFPCRITLCGGHNAPYHRNPHSLLVSRVIPLSFAHPLCQAHWLAPVLEKHGLQSGVTGRCASFCRPASLHEKDVSHTNLETD